MRLRILPTVVVAVAVAVAGCGSGTDESADEGCVILANGNELCGESARAYCERFARDSLDAETRLACRAVGTEPPARSAEECAGRSVTLHGCEEEYERRRGEHSARQAFSRCMAESPPDETRREARKRCLPELTGEPPESRR